MKHSDCVIASTYPLASSAWVGHDGSSALIRIRKAGSVLAHDDAELRIASAPPVTEPNGGGIPEVFAFEEAKCSGEKFWELSSAPIRSLLWGFEQMEATPKEVTDWVFAGHVTGQAIRGLFHILDIEPGSERHIIDHHLAHAALSFYTSDFSGSDFMVVDGGARSSSGGWTLGTWGSTDRWAEGEFFESSNQAPKSGAEPFGPAVWGGLCRFHNYVAEYLGFGINENGKLTGLASYGSCNEKLLSELHGLFAWDGDWPVFRVKRLSKGSPDFARLRPEAFDWTRVLVRPGDVDFFHMLDSFNCLDVAATAEYLLSQLTREMFRRLKERFGRFEATSFGGGLFNNVRVNYDLGTEAGWEKVHFAMAPADSGISLGAALFVSNKHASVRVSSAQLGPQLDPAKLPDLLRLYGLSFVTGVATVELAARIANGQIVGVFSGRAEFGPRSLGARSILGDPRDISVKSRLNSQLKRRDWFMPFAPAVIREGLSIVTDHPDACNPYMQVAVPLSSWGRKLLPGGTHVDGSARIQSVDVRTSPWFHTLISDFYKLTGVPAVLNTSFNYHGIATISHYVQAIDHLHRGCFDCLYLDGLLVEGRLPAVVSLDKRTGASLETEERRLAEDFVKSHSVRRSGVHT